VGGVKRFTITVVAGATVGIANLMPAEELALGTLYVLLAGVLVSLPVSVYLVAGARADDWMNNAEDWLTTNECLTSDALVRLLRAGRFVRLG
jgi:hypothetical protein